MIQTRQITSSNWGHATVKSVRSCASRQPVAVMATHPSNHQKCSVSKKSRFSGMLGRRQSAEGDCLHGKRVCASVSPTSKKACTTCM